MSDSGPARARFLPWLWAALALALVVRAGVRERGVITDHLEFGRRLLAGADPYAPYLEDKPLHPPYPPSFGLLTAPFCVLPERGARVAWGVVQVAALAGILAWLRRALLGSASRARQHAVLLLTVALGARFVLRDTHGGGGNLINLALVLCAFGASAGGRQGLGGILFGLSLATKPTAILLWPLLWLFGYRRAALCALGALGAAVALSVLCLRGDVGPWQRWGEGTWRYAVQADVFAPPAFGFPPFTWMNQCLRCALARALGDVPAAYAQQVPHFVQGLGWSAGAIVTVRSLASVALVAILASVAWQTRATRAAQPPVLAAALALSLLLSPISWKAHHVALLPAFAQLFARACAGRRALFGAAIAYAFACVLGEEITGKAVKELLQSSYLVTLGTLAFFAASLQWARESAEAPARFGESASR